MKILDKAFQIIFARFRRKMGDSNLEAAWIRARNKVAWYVGMLIAAATVILVAALYSVSKVGTHLDNRRSAQLIAAAAFIIGMFLLNQRFKKFLSNPPAVPPQEARTDWQFLFWYRVVVIGIFCLTCLVGVVLHETGVSFLRGL